MAQVIDVESRALLKDRSSSAYCALILAARMTFPHFSVSPAMNFPNSAGVIGIAEVARSARRPLKVGWTRGVSTCVCRKLRPLDLARESLDVGHDGRADLPVPSEASRGRHRRGIVSLIKSTNQPAADRHALCIKSRPALPD